MKIALFGNGKTGSFIANSGVEIIGPFTRARPATVSELRSVDVAILFVPGAAIPELLPILLEARIPVVSGATGRALSDAEKKLIHDRNIPWIQASNFSLGMNLAFELARRIQSFSPARELGKFQISEVHHTKKLDAPSGTALSLQQALGGLPVSIESIRDGDIIGVHELQLHLPGEILSLAHQATDRRVFAEGALWAARLLLEGKIPFGVHRFEDLVRTECFERNPS